ncbi:Beta-mannosidase [Beijerinckiaceae bacterium RH AL1]|nr:glycoside hydrolase family 2 protein [Beijerinckiaceae bacterium]VVB45714.1 Beta-mannosidase [Beijerinckiaceae bacterium RH CH11]VVB45789.1 Beta-mannosidase [Beijerinckiaceae bacterium RH AL8]VVC55003.1 Beta-mannosidase [Beijerinckiaceae bacterium RH AL1]
MRIGAWELTQTAPGAWIDAASIAAADWLPALVPGTIGASLQAAGRWTPDDGVGFDAFDVWYRAEITGDGAALLQLDGLATIAEVFLGDARVLVSDNMFVAHEIGLTLAGRHTLHIAFRSLDAHLAGKKGRARWRPKLVRPPALRFVRTLLVGHIPGWGPPVHAVGPYRGVCLVPAADLRIVERHIATSFDRDGDGLIDLAIRLSAKVEGWVTARCGDIDFTLVDDGDGVLRGRAEVPEVQRWWPATHGTPALYAVSVQAGGREFDLGKVGFRTIEVDRDADGKGFGLRINSEQVFCRGACWTPADIVALPFSREAYLPLLTPMRDAGLNMVRVGGTMGYEGDAFHALCDELGLLVWQDFAFSNFDYPAGDAAFRASVEAEVRQFLVRTQGSPSLAVLCGASEVAQQAAMLGMPAPLWSNAIFDELLPAVVAALRPDVPYTPHSPWGGDLPFVANEGISHYYGVSAHLRPIEEARRAEVRFSAESLGFANVPDVAPFALEPDRPEIVHRNDVERVPHEVGASWAFEAIRNHYTETLYGVDVAALRRDDPERFLAFARATSAEVIEATYAEWRRAGSPTQGALVWWWRDIFDGAGWGMLDARNAPKAAHYGLKRASRPVSVVLTDENLNGLAVSLINETAEPIAAKLSLVCLREGETVVMRGETELTLPARRTFGLAASTIWGGFFDTTYAFRFGDPSHDVTVARLAHTDGTLLAEAFHFPLGRGRARHDLGLEAAVEHGEAGAVLVLRTRRLAQSIRLVVDGYRPEDNYFHLAPGEGRRIALAPLGDAAVRPTRRAEPLNGLTPAIF